MGSLTYAVGDGVTVTCAEKEGKAEGSNKTWWQETRRQESQK